MRAYQWIPQDVLFCRDGRPMSAEMLGHGAGWPGPSLVFEALHAALYRAFPQVQLWEHAHAYGQSGQYPNRNERTQRFGSLATAGPFPCRSSEASGSARSASAPVEWGFPRPADWVATASGAGQFLAPVQHPHGSSSLPAPLCYPLGHAQPIPQPSTPGWLAKAGWEAYLQGTAPAAGQGWAAAELFGPEVAVGKNAVQSHAAEVLRLQEEISLGVLATLPLKADHYSEGLDRWLAREGPRLVLGGQQRVCRLVPLPWRGLESWLPLSAPVSGSRVKWVLLTPALFPAMSGSADGQARPHPGGWLPNWVAAEPFADPASGRRFEPGQVLLKKGDTARLPHEDREAWRRRVRRLETIDCRLVAARIPPPVTVTGWSERAHLRINEPSAAPGPRPGLQAVAAGAVYYFEGPEAGQLGEALAWHGAERRNIEDLRHRRSGGWGEQGYGLGVCGPWDFFQGA